ncbi:nucleoside-diphosphate sugar epimerase/dehydratase [Thioalkalivibrio sp. ALE20]|uniref:nucleoside-diphosphate sugar epimerase/dehydratase n=1 Tax=Thioalkalivibrio sp. ALE20 TaxID=545275 RepID=UPI0003771079|nr:nucleoside-diphosphate sugar epimerase/dehydratase [Thioalkalivibrio sp. ALE20]
MGNPKDQPGDHRTRWLGSLVNLPRRTKRWLMVAADVVMLPLALWTAFALRLAEPLPEALINAWWLFPLLPVVGVFIFARLGLYRAVVRFMGTRAVWSVATGVVLLAGFLWAAAAIGRLDDFPRLVPVAFALLAFIYVGGSRFLVRSWYQNVNELRRHAEPVLVYGAGAAGMQLAAGLGTTGQFRIVAFIDDNPALQGQAINGIRVHPPRMIGTLMHQYGIRRILLAVPSASRSARKAILERLEPYPLHVQSVPSMEAVVSGQARLDQLEDIDVADLLGRDPVPPQPDLLQRSIVDRRVMVTGAGGSIGSELCRRILRQGPAELVLFERNEFALYRIEQEMQALRDELRVDCPIHAVLGSVTLPRRVESVLDRHRIQTLYHAAAYKHVPIVEENAVEGVRNNVLGTRVLADAAIAAGVERFILISTDKAVRPTNVMGASKRLAEMILQDRAAGAPATLFSMVRFGNVLGSSGSVVPLFHRQIREGGPVTVTHPEITRYFMSIPEAAELVIQAGTMAGGGEVFVLDMGEPVRIQDLARRMIRLHGRQVRDDNGNPPDGIAIQFTGLRPGEKLYEELLIGDNVESTRHPRIMQAREDRAPADALSEALEALERADQAMDAAATRACLREIVPEYRPAG